MAQAGRSSRRNREHQEHDGEWAVEHQDHAPAPAIDAVDHTEKAHVGRSRGWTAVGQSEVECVHRNGALPEGDWRGTSDKVIKWQYLVMWCFRDEDDAWRLVSPTHPADESVDLIAYLREIGLEAWELVAIQQLDTIAGSGFVSREAVNSFYIFKRPIDDGAE